MLNIKNDNYVLIQGWMRSKFGLKGNELIIYSIIYGFTQKDGGQYDGSLRYICDWCDCTKQGAIKCLKSLVEKRLIFKEEYYKNNQKFCVYKANLDLIN